MVIKERRLAGVCGFVFAVTTMAAFILANPPGGKFHAGDVADFVAQSHRTAVIASLYLMLLSAVSLLGLGVYLRRAAFGDSGSGRLFTGLVVAAATSFFAGWTLVVTPAAAQSIGDAPTIDPGVAYTFMQAGFGVMLVGGGLMLGAALLTLAVAGRHEPAWLRGFAAVAGIGGLATPAFFPFFLVLLFGLVAGIWILASGRSPAAQAVTA